MTSHSFPYSLVPHDPRWSEGASREGERLQGVLGELLLCVYHIGSTSISGIYAKPVIDLLPVVTDLAGFDCKASHLQLLGYQALGEFGITGRRFFIYDSLDGRRMFHVHVFAQGDPHIARHLAFRDYMRAHLNEARAYEAEKKRCRELHPSDSGAYSNEKSAWIRQAEQRALAWTMGKKN